MVSFSGPQESQSNLQTEPEWDITNVGQVSITFELNFMTDMTGQRLVALLP